MTAELEGYRDQLLSIQQDTSGIVANLSDGQFNWRPAANRWSIGECFDHLNATARAYMPAIDRASRGGEAQKSRNIFLPNTARLSKETVPAPVIGMHPLR